MDAFVDIFSLICFIHLDLERSAQKINAKNILPSEICSCPNILMRLAATERHFHERKLSL
jgi:hypothetical protein